MGFLGENRFIYVHDCKKWKKVGRKWTFDKGFLSILVELPILNQCLLIKVNRLDKLRQKMNETDRQVKNKARRSQLRCDYILGRRDIVETSKSRQLHRAREMKTFNDLGFFF